VLKEQNVLLKTKPTIESNLQTDLHTLILAITIT